MRPISISLSPNTEKDDIIVTLKQIFSFGFLHSKGNAIEKLEKEFSDILDQRYSISFNSGRSSLMAVLYALKLKAGDEVLIQAFTCNAVPNPLLWSGLKPVYVDCEEDYNISSKDLETKITENSKAVIVQHTFGKPADMDKIQQICRENNLLLIEDCAHALLAEYKGRKVGSFGDASIFSFSRDKVISSVYGGMATTNNEEYSERLREFQKESGFSSPFWSLQQLLHPILMNLIVLPTYSLLGKYLLFGFQILHILSKAVHYKEKRGKKPEYFPKALPNTLALLALNQLKKVDRFNKHRKTIAEYYVRALRNTSFDISEMSSGNIYLRFPIRHKNAHDIIKKAWKKNILIGDWYTNAVAPIDTKLGALGYEKGSAIKAEELSLITFNLPTHIHISEKEANKVIQFLKNYENSTDNK